jgi:hypothetical protein
VKLHTHKLVLTAVSHPSAALSLAVGLTPQVTHLLFRCKDGCTDPGAYDSMAIRGYWTKADLDIAPAETALDAGQEVERAKAAVAQG